MNFVLHNFNFNNFQNILAIKRFKNIENILWSDAPDYAGATRHREFLTKI